MGIRPAERTGRLFWREYAEKGQKVYGNSEIEMRVARENGPARIQIIAD
jgi:hypothetical protein